MGRKQPPAAPAGAAAAAPQQRQSASPAVGSLRSSRSPVPTPQGPPARGEGGRKRKRESPPPAAASAAVPPEAAAAAYPEAAEEVRELIDKNVKKMQKWDRKHCDGIFSFPAHDLLTLKCPDGSPYPRSAISLPTIAVRAVDYYLWPTEMQYDMLLMFQNADTFDPGVGTRELTDWMRDRLRERVSEMEKELWVLTNFHGEDAMRTLELAARGRLVDHPLPPAQRPSVAAADPQPRPAEAAAAASPRSQQQQQQPREAAESPAQRADQRHSAPGEPPAHRGGSAAVPAAAPSSRSLSRVFSVPQSRASQVPQSAAPSEQRQPQSEQPQEAGSRALKFSRTSQSPPPVPPPQAAARGSQPAPQPSPAAAAAPGPSPAAAQAEEPGPTMAVELPQLPAVLVQFLRGDELVHRVPWGLPEPLRKAAGWTVDAIFWDYMESHAEKGGPQAAAHRKEVVGGQLRYFNAGVRLLLHHDELEAHDKEAADAHRRGAVVRWSQVYGVEPLVRQLARMPRLLCSKCGPEGAVHLPATMRELGRIMKWVADHWDEYREAEAGAATGELT